MDSVKLSVLEVKSLTNFTVKEVDTKSAKDYLKIEDLIQKTYAEDVDFKPKQEFEVGSYICVNTAADKHSKRAPKKWLRAVVRDVLITVGTYLFDVYLLDYGFQRMVKRVSVKELRPQFSDEFVKFQVMNFHLSDTDLKPDINTELNRQLVQQFLKSNDSLVSAVITKETNTNLLGSIRLSDGYSLTQFLIDKGLAFDKSTEVRKPKTSPFKIKPNKSVQNGVQINDYSTQSSPNSSVSSVSSTEISLPHNSSIESVDIDSSGQDLHSIPIKSVNGVRPTKGGKLRQMFTKIKLNKEREQMMSSAAESEATQRSDSPIDYAMHYNSKVIETDVDWPQFKDERRPLASCLVPAGSQPPPHVIERVYTLKQKQKN